MLRSPRVPQLRRRHTSARESLTAAPPLIWTISGESLEDGMIMGGQEPTGDGSYLVSDQAFA
jgi:hypothetical protein